MNSEEIRTTNKAGTILLNLENKKVCLINRIDGKGYEFPKGHIEKGETLQQCAIRETKEETMHDCHLLEEKPIGVVQYENASDGHVFLYYYIAIDDGKTSDEIKDEDKEQYDWLDVDKVREKLAFQNAIDLWDTNIEKIKLILNKNK